MQSEFSCVIGEDLRDLLSALCLRVRTFGISQICRTWPKAVSALSRLEREGMIYSFTAVVHPELDMTAPVTVWKRGEPTPDFGAASHILRSRWNEAAVPVKCVIATRRTGIMFGGHGGRYPRESEETHDLHLAAVYLRFRSFSPELAETWTHEEEIKRDRKQRRGKLPDALIGKKRVIEFGGAYKKPKLIAFHKYCEAHGFDYEVW